MTMLACVCHIKTWLCLTCKEESSCLCKKDIILQRRPCGRVLDGLEQGSKAARHRSPRMHMRDNGTYHALYTPSCA